MIRMKKTTIILLIGLLLVGIVTAGYFATKEKAINELKQSKTELQNIIKDVSGNIEFISDKICFLDWETEETYFCEQCFKYKYEGIELEECISVDETSTLEQDKQKIKSYIKECLERRYISEDYSYTHEERMGIKFDMEKQEI